MHQTGYRNFTLAVLLGFVVYPSLVLAHEGSDSAGFIAGFTHPIFGLDHLLAMISVGILSSQLGGSNIWRVPIFFVAFMVIGGTVGALGFSLALGEIGIALSVVVLGIGIVRSTVNSGPWLVMAFVSLFGFYHGHAHGLEMPNTVSPVYYTFGFIISTSLLHIAGVLLGETCSKSEKMNSVVRYLGAGMAGAGSLMLLQHTGVA